MDEIFTGVISQFSFNVTLSVATSIGVSEKCLVPFEFLGKSLNYMVKEGFLQLYSSNVRSLLRFSLTVDGKLSFRLDSADLINSFTSVFARVSDL